MSMESSTADTLPPSLPPSRPLSVDTSISSLESSSHAPSPNGILEPRLNSPASCSSLPSLSVKFAPLPELAPRKRRSAAPLGMAARSQLVRRRRGHYDSNETIGNNNMWTEEEMNQYRRNLAASSPKAEEEEIEDPFVALGRIMKGAGKTIWKRVSLKDMKKEKAADGSASAPSGEPSAAVVIGMKDTKDMRPILANISSNGEEAESKEEGKVWEEEIGEGFLLNVGQTETVIEGRAAKYPRPTGKVEVLTKAILPPKPSKQPDAKT